MPTRSELARFALVGGSGVVVNNAALILLHGVAGLPLMLASPLAAELAIVNNFIWNDRWTFAHRVRTRLRFLRFNLVALGGLVVNAVVLNATVALTGLHYLIANLIGIAAAMAWNVLANARWTWLTHDVEASSLTQKGHHMNEDLVIVPTYNEAENIERLVESVLEQGPFSVLVVDDGSPDGTGGLADRLAERHHGRVNVVHRTSKDGLGAAYRHGMDVALASGATRIYQMDADFSHDPAWLDPMRRALLQGVDLVIGSRYVAGGSVAGWPTWRLVLSRGGSFYAAAFLGLRQRDLTGGFKGWTRHTLSAIRPQTTRSDGYAFQVETTYRARLSGAVIAEIPIRFRDRTEGVSKMGWPILLEAIRVVPALRMRRPDVFPLPATTPSIQAASTLP